MIKRVNEAIGSGEQVKYPIDIAPFHSFTKSDQMGYPDAGGILVGGSELPPIVYYGDDMEILICQDYDDKFKCCMEVQLEEDIYSTNNKGIQFKLAMSIAKKLINITDYEDLMGALESSRYLVLM